ncbi:zinc-binding dehydrogenase [Roseateles sp. P5_E7]
MSVPSVMRAMRQTSLNGPDDLRLVRDAAVPVPGPGQVLIRVIAAGVNYADLSQSRGMFGGGPQPPYVAGFEAAGEVVAHGDGVSGPLVGSHVVGVGGGAFAEYMVLPAAGVVPVPAGWRDEQALGMVVNWPTTVAVLRLLGQVSRGQTVLVHAAAGATGQAAVRIAKHYGATVIATASAQKHDVVRALGADHVLDSRGTAIASEVLRLTDNRGADLVLESTGGRDLEESLAASKRITGRVVVFGLAGGQAALSNWDLVYKHPVQVMGFNIGVLIHAAPQLFGDVMREVFALIAAGVLRANEPTVYPLENAREALAKLERRESVGKLALTP